MAEVDQVAYSLGTEYFNEAAWFVSPSAAQILRSLETDEGVPYVRPDRADGLDRLHGRLLIVDSYLPSVEADSVPLFFGSVNAGYLITEETDLVVLTDPYSRSKFGEVVLSVYKFSDGRIRRADAIKKLVMGDGL
jgi:HK97 family phage major capsid protein